MAKVNHHPHHAPPVPETHHHPAPVPEPAPTHHHHHHPPPEPPPAPPPHHHHSATSPTPTPMPHSRDPEPAQNQPRFHNTSGHDTLESLAEQFGVTIERILRANPQQHDRWPRRANGEIDFHAVLRHNMRLAIPPAEHS